MSEKGFVEEGIDFARDLAAIVRPIAGNAADALEGVANAVDRGREVGAAVAAKAVEARAKLGPERYPHLWRALKSITVISDEPYRSPED